MRCVADNVEDVIIPDCGHWITEEQPQATTELVVDFLRRARSTAATPQPRTRHAHPRSR
jgi:hypothetical protein